MSNIKKNVIILKTADRSRGKSVTAKRRINNKRSRLIAKNVVMKVVQSKIFSLVSSALILVSLILTLVLLCTNTINDSVMKAEGGNAGESLQIGCGAVIVVFMIIFAFIAQVFAFLLTLLSVFPSKRKGLMFASNSFSIIFCILGVVVYLLTFISFLEISNGSSTANFVSFSLLFSVAVDLVGVVACICSMVVKGKAPVVKHMQDDLPKPFVIGKDESASDD